MKCGDCENFVPELTKKHCVSGYCKHRYATCRTSNCKACKTNFAPKVKINANWLRAVDDERLAEFLADAVYYGPTKGRINDRDEAVRLWLEWLKAQHKEV